MLTISCVLTVFKTNVNFIYTIVPFFYDGKKIHTSIEQRWSHINKSQVYFYIRLWLFLAQVHVNVLELSESNSLSRATVHFHFCNKDRTIGRASGTESNSKQERQREGEGKGTGLCDKEIKRENAELDDAIIVCQ